MASESFDAILTRDNEYDINFFTGDAGVKVVFSGVGRSSDLFYSQGASIHAPRRDHGGRRNYLYDVLETFSGAAPWAILPPERVIMLLRVSNSMRTYVRRIAKSAVINIGATLGFLTPRKWKILRASDTSALYATCEGLLTGDSLHLPWSPTSVAADLLKLESFDLFVHVRGRDIDDKRVILCGMDEYNYDLVKRGAQKLKAMNRFIVTYTFTFFLQAIVKKKCDARIRSLTIDCVQKRNRISNALPRVLNHCEFLCMNSHRILGSESWRILGLRLQSDHLPKLSNVSFSLTDVSHANALIETASCWKDNLHVLLSGDELTNAQVTSCLTQALENRPDSISSGLHFTFHFTYRSWSRPQYTFARDVLWFAKSLHIVFEFARSDSDDTVHDFKRWIDVMAEEEHAVPYLLGGWDGNFRSKTWMDGCVPMFRHEMRIARLR